MARVTGRKHRAHGLINFGDQAGHSQKCYGLPEPMQQLAELEAAIKADTDLRQRIVRSIGSSSIALFALLDDRGSHRLELAGSGTLVIVKGDY